MPVSWGVSVTLLLLETVDLVTIARLGNISSTAVLCGRHDVIRIHASKTKAEK